jgi:hypothetical protein
LHFLHQNMHTFSSYNGTGTMRYFS